MNDDPAIVTWRDAHFDVDEPRGGWPDDYLVETMGWVDDTDTDWVYVRGELTPDGPRSTTRIPKEIVRLITPLRAAEGES